MVADGAEADDLERPLHPVAHLGRDAVQPQDVEDHGYGLVTYFKVPGDFTVQLYQPRYKK